MSFNIQLKYFSLKKSEHNNERTLKVNFSMTIAFPFLTVFVLDSPKERFNMNTHKFLHRIQVLDVRVIYKTVINTVILLFHLDSSVDVYLSFSAVANSCFTCFTAVDFDLSQRVVRHSFTVISRSYRELRLWSYLLSLFTIYICKLCNLFWLCTSFSKWKCIGIKELVLYEYIKHNIFDGLI